MQKLIVLRGAPSSGKSSIARNLRNFEKKIAWLKVDNFKDFFSEDSSVALNYVNNASINILDYLLDNGFSVVMEGIFQDPTYISEAIIAAKNKGIPFKVYELECSLEELQRRDKNREGIKEGCREPLRDETITAIFKKLNGTRVKGAERLNTENLTLEEATEIVREDLEET